MADFLDKLRILKMMLQGTYDEWKSEVWAKELDQRYCCDGRECGCMASTVREVYGWKAKS